MKTIAFSILLVGLINLSVYVHAQPSDVVGVALEQLAAALDAMGNRIFDSTDELNLGTAAEAGSATSVGDVIVGGALEVDGVLYADGNITLPAAGSITYATRGTETRPADGRVLVLNTAGTSFDLYQFGGTTSSFPALKRSGPNLEVRAADDSGYSGIFATSLISMSATNRVADISSEGLRLATGTLGILFWNGATMASGAADTGISRLSAGVVKINNGSTGLAKLLTAQSTGTIAVDDTTPDVAAANVWTTSANTGATAITDLDNPTAGQIVLIIGGSDTDSSTIADSGNFNLSGAFTAALDDVLILYVQADNDYIELGRVNN